jgi:hypothetical protein
LKHVRSARFAQTLAMGALSALLSLTPAKAEEAARAASSPKAPSSATAPATVGTPSTSPATASKADLSAALYSLSKTQSLLEYFFLETGNYPDALEDMQMQYNQGLRSSDEPVRIPTDPATHRKLVYLPNADRTAYELKVPDAAAYGQSSLSTHQVDWGFMSGMATEARRKKLVIRCTQMQEMLLSTVMQYNRDNRNKFPASLESMVPKYLKMTPTCPACKKPYTYKKGERDAEVGCPDPASHGLEVFRFNSNDGLKRYP